jgi:hypothetical protein
MEERDKGGQGPISGCCAIEEEDWRTGRMMTDMGKLKQLEKPASNHSAHHNSTQTALLLDPAVYGEKLP